MRFLRHLAAVCLVVAVVVAGGLAWSRFGFSTLAGAGPPPGLAKQRAVAGRLAHNLPPGSAVEIIRGRDGRPATIRVVRARPMDLGLGSMFDPVNLPDLRHTVVIETGAAAAVILLSIGDRRWRRARRHRRPT